MKQKYFLQFAVVMFAICTFTAQAQSVPVYATSQTGLNGAEINSTTNGLATQMGDLIVLGGTQRFLNNVQVRVFNLASNAPYTLTMRIYTECMSSAAGCGAGPGTLIPGSEVTVTVTPGAVSTVMTVDIPYSGLDLSSQTDNTIAISMQASRNDVFWVLNEAVVVGANPAGETAASVVIRCGSTVAANNGCTRAFTDAINNFSMVVSASQSLSVQSNDFASKLVVYPNPSTGIINISSSDIVDAVVVMDLMGRTVKSTLVNDNGQIDISDLSAGNYVLKISNEISTAYKKIVKQ